MDKKKVELDKGSNFSKYIGKNCINSRGDKAIIVGYTIILNLFIVALLEETEYTFNMIQNEHLNYDIADSDDVILVHSPMFKGYCYDKQVIIEK